MTDIDFLKLAIENSQKSFHEGNFPAGAVVVNDGNVIASEVSSPYPGLFHADSKAVATAFKECGVLHEATLYVGLQPCLMCTSVVYWSGIRRVVYAVPKARVSKDYYETAEDTEKLVTRFNEHIDFLHISELEETALSVIHEWEAIHS